MESSKTATAGMCGAVIAAYGLALIIVGSGLSQHFGYPLDDSWIHQSVGRNLAWFQSFGYLPHQRSSGSTSVLWTLLLSLNYELLPSVNPVIYTLVINSLAVVTSGILLLLILRRDHVPRWVALLVAVAPAFDGNYLWLVFTGMEHVLFVTLSLATLWLWFLPTDESNPGRAWRLTVASGLVMGVLSMARPEGLVLPSLLIASSLLWPRLRVRPLAQIIAAGAIFAVLACVPLAISLYTSHSLLPVTYKGRFWLYASGERGDYGVRIELIKQWLSRPFKAVSVYDGNDLSASVRTALAASAVLLLALVSYGVYALVRQRRWLMLAVCAWGALHSLLYLVILPSSGNGGRYQPFLLLLLLPLLALGLNAVASLGTDGGAGRRGTGRGAVGLLVPTLVLLIVGSFSLPLWHRVLVSGIDHIERTHAVVAEWLRANLPDQKAAVFDIGRIGYERGSQGDPNLIDLGGLTDTSYIQYLYSGRVPDYLAEHHVHYLVLPTDIDGPAAVIGSLHLLDGPTVKRERLFIVCSPSADWKFSFSQTRHHSQCQEVDRVDFTLPTDRALTQRGPEPARRLAVP